MEFSCSLSLSHQPRWLQIQKTPLDFSKTLSLKKVEIEKHINRKYFGLFIKINLKGKNPNKSVERSTTRRSNTEDDDEHKRDEHEHHEHDYDEHEHDEHDDEQRWHQ